MVFPVNGNMHNGREKFKSFATRIQNNIRMCVACPKLTGNGFVTAVPRFWAAYTGPVGMPEHYTNIECRHKHVSLLLLHGMEKLMPQQCSPVCDLRTNLWREVCCRSVTVCAGCIILLHAVNYGTILPQSCM